MDSLTLSAHEFRQVLRIEAPTITRKWVADLRDAIDALPHDPWAIAQKMYDLGIRGVPGNGQDCPMSIYLDRLPFVRSLVNSTHIFAQPRDVDPTLITNAEWQLMHRMGGTPEWPFIMKHPPHIADFVRRFDLRCFPMLIR